MARTETNPTLQVLVRARESAGLPLGEAARRMGVTAECLRALEDGDRRPTSAQLRKFGDIYNMPLAALYPSESSAGSDHRVVAPPLVKNATQHSPLPTAEVESLSREEKIAKRVARTLGDPKGHPSMTIEEVASALVKSKPTIYRWIETGKLPGCNVPGRVPTKSVLRLLRQKHKTE
jgi:excisionase family DNA binding protein